METPAEEMAAGVRGSTCDIGRPDGNPAARSPRPELSVFQDLSDGQGPNGQGRSSDWNVQYSRIW